MEPAPTSSLDSSVTEQPAAHESARMREKQRSRVESDA